MATYKSVAPIRFGSKVFTGDYVIDTVDKRLFKVVYSSLTSTLFLKMIDLSNNENIEISVNNIISDETRYITIRMKHNLSATITWKMHPSVLKYTFNKIFK